MPALMYVCSECGHRYERGGYCAHDGKPVVETDDVLLGTEVGRYRVARLLGEGGMGRVYLAVQPAIGSRVAIKILSDQCARDPELLERFFAEARAVNLIRHESIISVIDMARLEDGRPYIVMEFIEGHTLKTFIEGGIAPLGGVVQAMGEVLSALAAAHAIGIVHRDLKPDNILVTAEGHAKVLDFGIAKLSPSLSHQLSPRTRTGALLGTPAYMAPEQISGTGTVDARTDVYAAGIVLFEAVTGRVPFRGETLFDLMKQHLEEPPPRPRLYRGDLPPELEQVILTALAKDPAQRFQSAGAMAQAMHHAASDLGPDHWRALSTSRGGMLGHPAAHSVRRPHPLANAPTVPTPNALVATHAAPTQDQIDDAPRRKLGVLIAIIGTAVIATGITLYAVRDEAPGTVVAQTPVEDSSAPVEPAGSATPTPTQARAPAPVVEEAKPPPPVPKKAPAPKTAPAEERKAAPPPPVAPAPAPAPTSSSNDGVIKIITPPGKTITERADYDPKRFDPVAYLPKALALAQRLIPDAKLTSFEFDPVFPDGRVDLTMEGRDREYNFRSVAASQRPAGVPRNMPAERACMVYVEVGVREVTAVIRTSEDCDARLVRHPRCSFAGVWKKARAAGVPDDLVARIGWLFDEKWFFDVDLEGKGGGVSSFEDCR